MQEQYRKVMKENKQSQEVLVGFEFFRNNN